MRRTVLSGALAAATWLSAGCSPATFTCESDLQCGSNGQCELDGECSFPDSECPSGRRYGSGSDRGCVDAAQTSSATSTGSNSTTGTSSTTSLPSTSDPDATSTSATTALSVSEVTTTASESTSESTSESPTTTTSEITSTGTTTGGASAELLLWLECDDGQSPPLDSSPSARELSCDGCPAYGDGYEGSGCGFGEEAGSDFARIIDAGDFNIQEFTVMTWISAADLFVDGCAVIASKGLEDLDGVAASWSLEVCLGLSGDDITVQVAACGADEPCRNVMADLSVEDLGEWFHVAYVVGAKSSLLYVNGDPRSGLDRIDIAFDSSPLYIGGGPSSGPSGPSGGSQAFGGAIDDLRIYDFALTGQQVSDIAN